VADQGGGSDSGGIEETGDPRGELADGAQGGLCRLAVAGQVDREGIPAVITVVAALQRPDTVVVGGAVDEYHRRLACIESAVGRVGVDFFAVDRQVHCRLFIRRGGGLRKDIH